MMSNSDSYYLDEEVLSKDDFASDEDIDAAMHRFTYKYNGHGGYIITGLSYNYEWAEGEREELIIPPGVVEIDDMAFQKCTFIKRVRIYSDLTRIGNCAFMECSGLTEINLPDTLTEIGYCAFEYCSSLVSLTIPQSLESVGNDAFWGCVCLLELIDRSSLDLTLHKSERSYLSKYAKVITREQRSVVKREGELYFMHLDGVPTLVRCIDHSVKIDLPELFEGEHYAIKNNAFESLYDLEQIALPKGLISIGSAAFLYCYSLREVTFPDGITEIPPFIFHKCFALESISIPSSVITVREGSCLRCKSLKSVYYRGTKKQWKGVRIVPADNKDFKKAKKYFEK